MGLDSQTPEFRNMRHTINKDPTTIVGIFLTSGVLGCPGTRRLDAPKLENPGEAPQLPDEYRDLS